MARGGPILVELEEQGGNVATLVNGRVPCDGSAVTQPVSAASLPLPTGAATQTTLASLLTELQAKADLAETQPVSGPVTDSQLRATAVPVSLASVPSHAVTGPLTDTELRATAVPVSGPLTDTQLRATPVPVSGTVTANAGTGTLAVSGPLTDTQLRATAVPTDPSDRAARDMGKIDVASLDQYTPVAGRLPVDGSGVTQPVSGPLTDTQLRATPVPVSGTVTANAGTGTMAVSGPLTDAQLRATAVPVSGTVTANPATAAGKTLTYVSVNQSAAGTTQLAAASVGNKHKIVGGLLVMSVLGTLKFTDGVGDLTGPMDIAANAGFVLPPSPYPYQETGATNRALNLVTTLGAARGSVVLLTEA